MLSTVCFLFVVSASPLLALDIPESCERNTFYLEMGCTPVFEKGTLCPVEYDCGAFEKFNPSMCYFNGKAYAKDAKLGEEENTFPCQTHCVCQDSYPKTSNADWRCASVECFGDTQVEGCVDTFTRLTECCRNGTYCEKTDPKPKHTCSYKGKTYVEGQKIEDEDKCRTCICDANFKDTLQGPLCQHNSCGHMLRQFSGLKDGCVPVYFGKSHCSCPIQYKCPESTDAIVPSTKVLDSASKPGRNCKFGDLTLKVGDKLAKGNELFECSCVTPPYLTCIQKPYEEPTLSPLGKGPSSASAPSTSPATGH